MFPIPPSLPWPPLSPPCTAGAPSPQPRAAGLSVHPPCKRTSVPPSYPTASLGAAVLRPSPAASVCPCVLEITAERPRRLGRALPHAATSASRGGRAGASLPQQRPAPLSRALARATRSTDARVPPRWPPCGRGRADAAGASTLAAVWARPPFAPSISHRQLGSVLKDSTVADG